MKGKRKQSIEQMVKNANMQLVDLFVTDGNHIAAIVKAANGACKKFFFSSTPSDYRGDKNKLSMLRRFSAENAHAH